MTRNVQLAGQSITMTVTMEDDWRPFGVERLLANNAGDCNLSQGAGKLAARMHMHVHTGCLSSYLQVSSYKLLATRY